jgi:predicted nucleic-acid-binding Zn-ribbon protein
MSIPERCPKCGTMNYDEPWYPGNITWHWFRRDHLNVLTCRACGYVHREPAKEKESA